jgi:hypothetical protein
MSEAFASLERFIRDEMRFDLEGEFGVKLANYQGHSRDAAILIEISSS